MKQLYTLLFIFIFAISTQVADANILWNNDPGAMKITRYYPNPANSYINFEFQKQLDKGCVLQLYNAIGKKVTEIAVTGNKLTLSLENYYRGIYFFLLCDKYGRIIDSAKFQVVK